MTLWLFLLSPLVAEGELCVCGQSFLSKKAFIDHLGRAPSPVATAAPGKASGQFQRKLWEGDAELLMPPGR